MTKTAVSVWDECLSFIKDNIKPQAYKTWFDPIKPVKLSGEALTIQVPSKFFYEWLEEHYIKLLRVALVRELGKDAKLIYDVRMENTYSSNRPQIVKIPSSNRDPLKPQKIAVPLEVNKRELRNPFVIPGLQKVKIESQLNANYNFKNFVEGDSNRLARSAGMAVANKPGGTSFNPLLIYGGVGLGKTHLAHAIGVDIKDKYPDKTVLYISSEKFTQQFIDSVKSNTRNDFIHFYQMVDVLLIDDVQFLSGKAGTQDVFFHIFNHLHQNGKQVILTSDKAPIDMQDIEQRLLSRFKWGLSAELQNPNFETRVSILKNKLYRDGVEIQDDVIEFVAKNINSNVRELEGAIISLIAQSSFNKAEITVELAKEVINKFVKNNRREVSIDYIQKVVSDYFQMDIQTLQSKTRKRHIVQARQIAMYFAKKFTKASLASIGTQIGRRDHATVLHACKTVDNLSFTDKQFRKYVEDLNQKLSN
jgi:chromosomal replication initiator protein